MLADETPLIHFVQIHLDDLRAIISTTDEITPSGTAASIG
jgi:hypothetical protein